MSVSHISSSHHYHRSQLLRYLVFLCPQVGWVMSLGGPVLLIALSSLLLGSMECQFYSIIGLGLLLPILSSGCHETNSYNWLDIRHQHHYFILWIGIKFHVISLTVKGLVGCTTLSLEGISQVCYSYQRCHSIYYSLFRPRLTPRLRSFSQHRCDLAHRQYTNKITGLFYLLLKLPLPAADSLWS